MIKVFLDTNVVLDALVPGRPYEDYSRGIVGIGGGDYRLCVSSLSVATLHYVAKKHVPTGQLMTFLKMILDRWKILPLGDIDVWQALRSSCPDFEDALQISCAEGYCDVIVTADKKHFESCTAVPVFTPEEFIGQLRAHSGADN